MDLDIKVGTESLAEWVVSQAKADSLNLIKYLKEGRFNLKDYEVPYKEGQLGIVFHELLFLYFYLSSIYLFRARNDIRDNFLNSITTEIAVEVCKIIGMDMDTDFVTICNERSNEYADYQRLLAAPNEEKEGSLFWEFGKKISNLIDKSDSNLIIILIAQSTALQAWKDLWDLELFHKKQNGKHPAFLG